MPNQPNQWNQFTQAYQYSQEKQSQRQNPIEASQAWQDYTDPQKFAQEFHASNQSNGFAAMFALPAFVLRSAFVNRNPAPRPQQMYRHPDTGRPIYENIMQPPTPAQPAPTLSEQLFPALYSRPTPAPQPAPQSSAFMKTKFMVDNANVPFEQQLRWDPTAKNGKGAYAKIGDLVRQGKLDLHTGKSKTAATTLDFHLDF